MANENEDVLKANQGAPAADIPDLKKKEKERKKAGAAWSGARGAAGEFTGATGGTVSRAAASAAGAMAEGAAAVGAEAGGGFLAGLSRFLAGLTSTLLGKLAVAAAAFLLMAGAGLVGYALLKGGGNGDVGGLSLGAISDSMRVRAGGNDRMGVASNGELRFDPLAKNAPPAQKTEEAKPEEKKPDVEPKPDADTAKGGLAGQDKLAHNLSGAKLSSSLGGDFGNKNIFAGNSAAPKFGDALAKGGLPKFGAQKGKLGGMQAKTPQGTTTARSIGKAKTSRAIGQLKMAKGMSMLGAQAGSVEAAAAASQGAFDQQQTNGGALNTPGGPGGTVNPVGGGAPDTSMPTAPTAPTGSAVDPGLQNALDQIGSMADTARQMQQNGIMLMGIGAALIVVGAIMVANAAESFGLTAIIGMMLIMLGGMLVGMGMMMMQMAQMMSQMAKSMGAALAAQTGNMQQGKVINYCTDQALQGTATKDCNPPESITQGQKEDARGKSDVQRVKAIGNDKPVITQ